MRIVRTCLLGVMLMIVASAANAQLADIRPYLGISGNFLGSAGPGWGVEAGAKWSTWYGGLEYGGYGYPMATANTTFQVSTNATYNAASDGEQYVGVHAGYVLSDRYYAGLVLLHSGQDWLYRSVATDSVYTQHWTNIGIDFRYMSSADQHFFVDGSYSVRRGVKVGVGFML